MILKTRRYIFWSFLILFILAGAGAIFYSDGWRINSENCSFYSLLNCANIQRTGAVFVKTSQKNILIKINDKIFSDKSGIFQNGTLISNLLPKNYHIEIEKDGYQSWQKNVEVKPALVSKLTKIILIPNVIEKQILALPGKLNNFYFNSKEEIVFQNSDGLYYNQKNVPLKLRGNRFVSWNEAGDAFITIDSAKNTYYLYRLNDLSKIFNVSASFNNLRKNIKIKEIVFHPADPEKVIIETENELYILDLIRLKIENINEGNLAAWTVQNPNIYYLKKIKLSSTTVDMSSFGIFSFNLILKNETSLYKFPETGNFSTDGNLEILADSGKTAVLKGKHDILIVNFQNKELKRIAAVEADNIIFSPDKHKIAFTDAKGKISIYFLENEIEGLSKNKDEIIEFDFYSDNSFKIKNIFWYKDSSHFLVEYADEKGRPYIDFIEIDSRAPINRYELAQGEKINYDPKLNRLYFIQKNNLYFLDLSSF